MGTVTVFGAYGHTGRFVVTELLERGFVPVLAGRDAGKLAELAKANLGLDAGKPSELGKANPGLDAGNRGELVQADLGLDAGNRGELATASRGLDAREAWVEDPASLDRALAGADAVINCAGPFADTAAPVIEAALRAGIAYVDVAAEIEANLDTFELFADRARAAGVVVVPAMAFFGGLGDLLATAAMGDWTKAAEAHIAYGLSSWHPTAGTRAAGRVSARRREGRRVRYSGGGLEYRDDEAPRQQWPFPEPMGSRDVIAEFAMADVVSISSHLSIREVRSYMTVEAARDVSSPDTPAPVAVDERGRSGQSFVIDVVVRSQFSERRAVASGQDIYAVSAPLAVEAVHRILTGRTRTAGVASAGAIFDAKDFLKAMSPHLEVQLP